MWTLQSVSLCCSSTPWYWKSASSLSSRSFTQESVAERAKPQLVYPAGAPERGRVCQCCLRRFLTPRRSVPVASAAEVILATRSGARVGEVGVVAPRPGWLLLCCFVALLLNVLAFVLRVPSRWFFGVLTPAHRCGTPSWC
mmetsp:Transcript_54327/g.144977  ORF Transcript_54327/g.144977 Transcript_54327/m.144977 type:complete len:141 (+) Transcript_54327:1737-2159(+)